MNPITLSTRRQQCSQGFTLVELLVYAAIASVVITAIAVLTISQVRIARRAEEVQNLKDEWNMAAAFIKEEITRAESVSTTVGTYPCGGTAPANPLVLTGPNSGTGPAWSVVYGVRDLGNLPTGEVATNWIGPNVLVRCGRPYLTTVPAGSLNELDGGYNANAEFFGLLNPAQNATATETVVLDRLPDNASFSPALAATSSTSLARDVNVTLGLQSLFGGNYTSQFRGRAAASPTYGLPEYNDDLGIACTTNPCRTTSYPNPLPLTSGNYNVWEYRAPSAGTLAISPTGVVGDRWEVVVYFPGNIGGYTIQRSATNTATCNRVSCYVSNGTTTVSIDSNSLPANSAFAGIVLSFADRERRV
jgi:type II secretory pathway pseudopilin PulG